VHRRGQYGRTNRTSFWGSLESLDRLFGLAAKRGLIRPRDLAEHGLPSVTLTRLVRQGPLNRVGRGLYALVFDFHKLLNLG